MQTIYSAFGTKARILARVTEVWMRETKTRALAEEYFEEPDAGRRLQLFAALNRHQLEAGADVLGIYREAARTDPSMEAALEAMMGSRAREIAKLLASVQADLRAGLTRSPPAPRCTTSGRTWASASSWSRSGADALAITLALCVDAVYTVLRDAGWSGARYEQWLGEALIGQMLRD